MTIHRLVQDMRVDAVVDSVLFPKAAHPKPKPKSILSLRASSSALGQSASVSAARLRAPPSAQRLPRVEDLVKTREEFPLDREEQQQQQKRGDQCGGEEIKTSGINSVTVDMEPLEEEVESCSDDEASDEDQDQARQEKRPGHASAIESLRCNRPSGGAEVGLPRSGAEGLATEPSSGNKDTSSNACSSRSCESLPDLTDDEEELIPSAAGPAPGSRARPLRGEE